MLFLLVLMLGEPEALDENVVAEMEAAAKSPPSTFEGDGKCKPELAKSVGLSCSSAAGR
jgi:hypothetical protein